MARHSFFNRFGEIVPARFVDRPNRFIVVADIEGEGRVRAHMPNPGRLHELLFPGVTLQLARARDGQERKTQFTVLSVERDGAPVFLHTHVNNDVARHLLEHDRVPGLEGAQILRAEAPVGRSRFDFLLELNGAPLYLEVKSCTLFGNGIAMFPDAITERGRKHLEELAAMSREGIQTAVMFLTHSDRVDYFMPDYHTDLAFSQMLLNVRDSVPILPISLGWKRDLILKPRVRQLEIPWEFIAREAQDTGAYLLLLELRKPRKIDVGSLGAIDFSAGHYIYVGSAMKNLTARVNRHLRRRKSFHWHIDYLRDRADACVALPIRGSRREECDLAGALADLYERGPAGFGASDCDCPAHLFRCEENPLQTPLFHEFLQRFRMKKPR